MRQWMLAVSVSVVALAAVGALGSAGAQAPTPSTDQRLITVNGGAAVDLASDANAEGRRTAYRSALSRALDDAKDKAGFIAERTGVTLGGVHAVTEQSGSVLDGCEAFATADGVAARPRPLKRKRPAAKRPKTATPRAVRAEPPPPPALPPPYRCQAAAHVSVSYAVTG